MKASIGGPDLWLCPPPHLAAPPKVLALRCSWVRQAYHVTYSNYARRVAILINKSLSCSVGQVVTDPGGKYLITIRGSVYAFVTVYSIYLHHSMLLSSMRYMAS